MRPGLPISQLAILVPILNVSKDKPTRNSLRVQFMIVVADDDSPVVRRIGDWLSQHLLYLLKLVLVQVAVGKRANRMTGNENLSRRILL